MGELLKHIEFSERSDVTNLQLFRLSVKDALNARPRLEMLVVEAAFSNEEEELCRASRHYCPKLLAADLFKLKHNPKICLTHAKPGEEERIYLECRESIVGRQLVHLSGGEVFAL